MNHLSQKTFFARLLSALLLAAFALAGAGAPASAEAVVSFEQRTAEFSGLDVGIYCGPGGGEIVTLSGSINILYYVIENAAGGSVQRSKVSGINVTGVGQDSGAIYRVNQVSSSFSVENPSGRSHSLNLTIDNLAGKGAAANSNLSMIFSVHVNPDGSESVVVEHYSYTCR